MNNFTASYKNSFIEAVILANKELYNHIKKNSSLNDYEYTNTIGFGGDNSLKMDLIAENIFIKYLEDFGNIYSEECGLRNSDKESIIVIDPLDGSNNFYSNLPYYGTSIALQKDGITIAGFVTNLITGIINYRAFDGNLINYSIIEERELNIFQSKKTKISIFERAYEYPDICKKLSEKGIKYRSLGAVALSLADARNYDFVLYCGNIREFDIAASLYICKDLLIYETEKTLLISQDKQKFDLIKEFINEV